MTGNPSPLLDHYGRPGLADELLAAVDAAFGPGLTAEQLHGVDQFHLGGHVTTDRLVDELQVDLDPDANVLDVGCGIGGVARRIAGRVGCRVTGVDLSPAFVDAARRLTNRVMPDAPVDFRVGDALAVDGGSVVGDRVIGSAVVARFDACVVVHVGMNIADKDRLCGALAEVTRPGGMVVICDIVRRPAPDDGDPAPLDYPVPWAPTDAEDHSAVEEVYREAIATAGLDLRSVVDLTDLVVEALASAAAAPPPVTLRDLMGEGWPTMIGHLGAALRAGHVAPVQFTATVPGVQRPRP